MSEELNIHACTYTVANVSENSSMLNVAHPSETQKTPTENGTNHLLLNLQNKHSLKISAMYKANVVFNIRMKSVNTLKDFPY